MKKIIMLTFIVIMMSSVAFASVDFLGWGYKITDGSGTENITYDYSSLTSYITNESNLDLYKWNGTQWTEMNATLNSTENSLVVEQSLLSLPIYIALGESS